MNGNGHNEGASSAVKASGRLSPDERDMDVRSG